ncbi:amidohydrolase [Phenylobacterium sp. VNQ135]|uniref:amidohydrolase n=1 Tax=Phenylobacterium sp. VNQ135 TaxID=3400922 RepID=UPI003BFC57B6
MRRSGGAAAGALALVLALWTGGSAHALPLPQDTLARVTSLTGNAYPELEALYQDLHRNPEVAFQETRTAEILARRMEALGFDVTRGVGGTGFVAILRNGAGPTVMVRTEMDGLPMEEKTGLPYASKATGVFQGKETPTAHACGHDIHMASWIGAAKVLTQLKDRWSGTLMFVAQPAEEGGHGAEAMLKDGIFKRFPKPDRGFALHVGPSPAGQVVLKDGQLAATAEFVNLTFKGRGAHGSRPDEAIDPIMIASAFVTNVQPVVSRQREPNTHGVISVGSFNAGSTTNIIPEEAVLQLTLRALNATEMERLKAGVRRTAEHVAAMNLAPPPVLTFRSGGPPLTNDRAVVAQVTPALRQAFGDAFRFIPAEVPATGGADDYTHFVEAGVPSAYIRIGGADPAVLAAARARGEPAPANHSPFFAPLPEPSIKTGVRVLSVAVLDALKVRKP